MFALKPYPSNFTWRQPPIAIPVAPCASSRLEGVCISEIDMKLDVFIRFQPNEMLLSAEKAEAFVQVGLDTVCYNAGLAYKWEFVLSYPKPWRHA
jgi:hypothetical protein